MATSSNDLSNVLYKMDHGNRGYVVIIDNYEFTDECFQTLGQHNIDVDNYKNTFKNLGFKDEKIEVCQNLKKHQMIEKMNHYANQDYTDCDCFIAVFLSHGVIIDSILRIKSIDEYRR